MAKEVKFTKDQCRLVLTAMIGRLQKPNSGYTISKDANDEVKIENRNTASWQTVVIYSSNRVHMILPDMNGVIEPSMWWFKDQELKLVINKLHSMSEPLAQSDIDKALVKIFPEIVDEEFEHQILK